VAQNGDHGSPVYFYIGSVDGIKDHIINRENDPSFLREVAMFNGDHPPVVDSQGNAMGLDVEGKLIHQVRVGDGYHFHNIVESSAGFPGLALFHHDQYPPTSVSSWSLHGIEWASIGISKLLAGDDDDN